MKHSLPSVALELDLGSAVVSAGFEVVDHAAIILDLANFEVEGMPSRAVAKRRAEFLAGRLAAREALRMLGFDAVPGRNDDGSPRWPAGVTGSISHGAGRAFCAVARARDVRSLGIDVERLMGPEAKAELRARICSDDECRSLSDGLGCPEHHLVTFAFSAKESLYKCLYPLGGQFMDFSAARVVAAEGALNGVRVVGELTLELSVDWSPELPRGRRLLAKFTASEQHVASAVLLPA